MATAESFEELEIWKKSINLAIDFYSLIKQEPLSKDYSLYCKRFIRRSKKYGFSD